MTTPLYADLLTQIEAYVSQPPKPWMRIRGTHKTTSSKTSSAIEIVDFDISIDCSTICYVESIAFKYMSDPSWTVTASEDYKPVDTSQPLSLWFENIYRSTNEEQAKQFLIHKVATNIDPGRIIPQITSLAKLVAYGGNVTVSIHDLEVNKQFEVSQLSATNSTKSAANKPEIKVGWNFIWPCLDIWASKQKFLSSLASDGDKEKWQTEWRYRLCHAMVNQKQGWLSENDLIPVGSPTTNAWGKFGLVKDKNTSQSFPDGGSISTLDVEKWGCDE